MSKQRKHHRLQKAKLRKTVTVSKTAQTHQVPKRIDASVLFEDYIPKKLVVRDNQVKTIRECIDSYKKTGLGYNLELNGLTGASF